MLSGQREEKEKVGKTSGTSERGQSMQEKVSILGNVFIHQYRAILLLFPLRIIVEQPIF